MKVPRCQCCEGSQVNLPTMGLKRVASLESLSAAVLGAEPKTKQWLEEMDAQLVQLTRMQRGVDQPLPSTASDTTSADLFGFVMQLGALLDSWTLNAPSNNKQMFQKRQQMSRFFHIARIVAFCQVFAPRNRRAVTSLMHLVVTQLPQVKTQLDRLQNVYLDVLAQVHEQVLSGGDATQSLDQIHEILLALQGVYSVKSEPWQRALRAPHSEAPDASILVALARCYELVLPKIARTSGGQRSDRIGVIRNCFLETVAVLIEAAIASQQKSAISETLLAILYSLSSATDEQEAAPDHGSLLSDLWTVYGFRNKCECILVQYDMDSEHLSYIDMVVDNLPKRREASPLVTAAASATIVEDALSDWKSLVHQVQELFPDLGDGFIRLCLEQFDDQVDRVINALLEDSLPARFASIPRDLAASSADFDQHKNKLSDADVVIPAAQPARQLLDPSKVWMGKRRDQEEYKAESIRSDNSLVDKMKQRLLKYDEIDAFDLHDADEKGSASDYDDDYDDERDEYEPFGVNDSRLEDLDEIRDYNRRLREKEAEDEFWENMRNPNHISLWEEEEEEEKEEEKAAQPPAGQQQSEQSGPTASPAYAPRGAPERKPVNQNQNKQRASQKKSHDSKAAGQTTQTTADASGETSKDKQLHNRARKDRNKAKVGNHHRKDRALKKQIRAGGL